MTDLNTLTAPTFVRAFTALSKILDKARAFAAEQGMPKQELLDLRLIDDKGTGVASAAKVSYQFWLQ